MSFPSTARSFGFKHSLCPSGFFKRFVTTLAVSVCFTLLAPMALAQDCGGYNGAGPIGGVSSVDNGRLCLNKPGAPAEINIAVANVGDGDNPANFGVEVDWDDGSPRQVILYGGAVPINNVGPHAYQIPSITHDFLPRPCGSRPGGGCGYRPKVYLRLAGATCPTLFGTSPDFFRFNTDQAFRYIPVW